MPPHPARIPDRRRPRESRGFTLIEMVVSLFIMSLISIVVLEAYRAGLGIWEREHKESIALNTAGALMQRLRAQVRSAYPWSFQRRGKTNLYFKGEKNSLQFASLVGLSSRRADGLIHILRFTLEEGGRLRVEEYPWPRRDFPEGEEPLISEIVEGIDDFSLEYMVDERKSKAAGRGVKETQEETGGKEWRESWPGETGPKSTETIVAVSVSLSMKTGEDSRETFTAVIPVMRDLEAVEG